MGKVIENEEGFVLYRFDNDKNNPSKTILRRRLRQGLAAGA